MPKIETVYCAKCGAANQGYEREDGAAMVLQTNGKYENSNIAGCSSCQKYPTGVDEVWTVQDEAVYAPLRKKMPESFTVEVQALRRIAIPKINYELLGLKQGDRVRVTVEKVE